MHDSRPWVARVTRHPLLPPQRAELEALFGSNVRILQFDITHNQNLDKAIINFDSMLSSRHYIAVEVVASSRILGALLRSRTIQSGTILIRPVMSRLPEHLVMRDEYYSFEGYERIIDIREITEHLMPPYVPSG